MTMITIVTIYPVVQVVGTSLRPGDRLYSTSLRPFPEDATFDAYRAILFEKPFPLWFRNSFVVAFFVTVLGVSLASSAGYAFSRFRFPGRGIGMSAFLVTQMFPATMLLLPLYMLMRRIGLTDSLPGLAVAYTATALPFCVWTMKGYFDSIPIDLEEAAFVDGASRVGAFLRVLLPLAAPALAITALFSFMAAWSEFMVARVILSSKEWYTLPLGLEGLAGTFQTEWANYSAGAVLVSIPAVAVFLALNRFLVGGLTLGGVKD
ncbi:MAG: ABC transporter [Gemmatimonadetes bacterium]|jgi:arabinogalactan oligomer/maltooligosaccharide transport system permease protein|nr:ABC transporter [Gemmatimonadota bacterium]